MNKTALLFLIILFEGYVVLACELLAIRQLIPFVGSGTETVSIIISAVLLPLAIGYHAGGNAFKKAYQNAKAKGRQPKSIRKLLLKNILTALFIFTVGLSYVFMEAFFQVISAAGLHNRLAQTALYSLIFLVFPVFLLGQTVPLVSNYFSRARLSEITGKMLFFSTAGSFLGSVFSTIVLMMIVGVHNTVIVTLALLYVLIGLLVRRWYAYEVWAGGVAMLLLISLNNGSAMASLGIVSNNAYNLVSIHENKEEGSRLMIANRSASSKLALKPEQQFKYVRFIERYFLEPLNAGGPPRDILIIGAGGFTMGLNDKHNRYTYVDIDKALKDVSVKHFLKQELSDNKTFVAASARAFVHGSDKLYDLIVLDAYTNVFSIPMECTTREFLQDVKKLLKKDGIVLANVISNPNLADKFSQRYNNTFASVFPSYTRQIVGNFEAWASPQQVQNTNVIYIYHHGELADDRTVYTDDMNTFSIDRK